MATLTPPNTTAPSSPESAFEDSSGSDDSPFTNSTRVNTSATKGSVKGDSDLQKRLRNRYSSAKFRERQRLHVDELRAQIAHFERENQHLELRIQAFLSGAFQADDLATQVNLQTPSPSVSHSELPLRIIEVLSDKELMSAIQSSFSSIDTHERTEAAMHG